ncbi:MAG: 2-C-methyl-D-erythritol 4-phosphate cytidylyltransferase [Lachnospiraceae bacterium]|nr:2-C-methyl-D-erythritol 4-phosphate cytidylyltransferase [Lachnospiraceae bacterium]
MGFAEGKNCCAIVLAAGVGKRMNSHTPKQFMLLEDKPLLYYSLKTFQDSFIEKIILVTGAEEIEYCQEHIVDCYEFNKVQAVVAGGKERYHSVYEGLKAAEGCDYVFIHDGARPFVNHEMLKRAYEAVEKTGACVVGVKAKDTIKVADDQNFVVETPNRNYLWQVQTPQVFEYSVIKQAHEMVMDRTDIVITDDAFVYECAFGKPVKLVEGDYRNIKITTPEDMLVAKAFLQGMKRD